MSPSDSNFDAWLDGELNSVPLPAGLLGRLRRAAVADDEELDAALRDVPIPLGLLGRLERIGRRRLHLSRLVRLATAASLILTIGISYVGAIVGIVVMAATVPDRGPAEPPLRVALLLPSRDDAEPEALEGLEMAFQRKMPLPVPPEPIPPDPEVAWLAEDRGPERPLEEVIEHLLEDRYLQEWPEGTMLGSPGERPPEILAPTPRPERRGIAPPPLVPGYELFSKYRVLPFIAPGSSEELSTSVVPLDVEPLSYERIRQRLEEGGRLPPARDLRTEEFLAAVDFGFTKPQKEALGLFAGGGTSPFRGPGVKLLQFGVEARDVSREDRPPLNVTFAVDVSRSMESAGRLEMVRRALEGLAAEFGPGDRVSLVAFSGRAVVLAEGLPGDAQRALGDAIAGLQADRSTDLAAGLREAYAAVQRVGWITETDKRVVLLTDGLAPLEPATVDRVATHLADVAGRGVRLDVVELGQPSDSPDTAAAVLAEWAAAAGGRVYRANHLDEVQWALLEAVTGRPQLVASDVRLTVRFRPRSVAAYRLVGHEPGPFDEVLEFRPETDFHAGQSATVLYEVVLRDGSYGQVAEAELSWTDPVTGKSRRVLRRVNRGQLKKEPIEAPLSVQAAAVVAEAAEVLRETPEVLLLRGSLPAGPNGKPVAVWRNAARPRGEKPLARVLYVAGQLDSRLSQQPGFSAMMETIERAANPSHAGG